MSFLKQGSNIARTVVLGSYKTDRVPTFALAHLWKTIVCHWPELHDLL